MTKMTASEIATIIQQSNLAPDQLLQLHKLVGNIYRAKQETKQIETGMKFVIGDIVSFTPTQRKYYGQKQYIKITGFNRAGTCLIGSACDQDGTPKDFGVKWTVANSLCTLHKSC